MSAPDSAGAPALVQASWSGPWVLACLRDGSEVSFDPVPLTAAAVPSGVSPEHVRAIKVRWRVTGFTNARKETLIDPLAAQALARRIAQAATAGEVPDAKGRPVDHREPDVAVSPLGLPVRTLAASGPAVPSGDDLERGETIAEYIQRLVTLNLPQWKHGGSDEFWLVQLSNVERCYRYAEDDSRISTHGVEAGASIHLRLLLTSDFETALMIRRCTDLKAAHLNRQQRQRYERLVAGYEEKLARFEQGSGPRGRKPVPPVEPTYRPEFLTDPTQVSIKAATEKHFRTAQSFVFDRAFTDGLMAPGPNLWRKWNPVGTGGRGQRSSPYRTPTPAIVSNGTMPPAAFFVDLGDELARRGEVLTISTDGGEQRRSGERYRYLPLIFWQTLMRPEEFSVTHKTAVKPSELIVAAVAGDHLKHRREGEVRPVPLSSLISWLLDRHIQAQYVTDTGLLMSSPAGCAIDLSNYLDDFLRPALTALTAPEGLWPEYATVQAKNNLMRKAGITSLIEFGAPPSDVARWAGHDEQELWASYKGVLEIHSGNRIWQGHDHFVAAALADQPPRGRGQLAGEIRDWLQQP